MDGAISVDDLKLPDDRLGLLMVAKWLQYAASVLDAPTLGTTEYIVWSEGVVSDLQDIDADNIGNAAIATILRKAARGECAEAGAMTREYLISAAANEAALAYSDAGLAVAKSRLVGRDKSARNRKAETKERHMKWFAAEAKLISQGKSPSATASIVAGLFNVTPAAIRRARKKDYYPIQKTNLS